MPDNMYVWMDGCRGSEASTPRERVGKNAERPNWKKGGDKGFCGRELRAFSGSGWTHDGTTKQGWTIARLCDPHTRTVCFYSWLMFSGITWCSCSDRATARHTPSPLMWFLSRSSSPSFPLAHPAAHNSDAAPRSSSQWNANARLQRRRAESGCSRFSTGDSHLQQKVQLCFLHILGKIVCTWLNKQPSFSKQGPHAENTQW